MDDPRQLSLLDRVIRFCLLNKLVVVLFVLLVTVWGVSVAPFDWEVEAVPRDPVPVDAIPDTGENQQIVFTEWMGRSPQDVEDQITYPLTVALLGVPKVRTIRSTSMFGFSSIFVIFEEGAEFYWARSRILEKLNSLSAGTVPEGVQPALGPDATPLGQVFWYTLEGRDPQGRPTGGWDLQELRTIQDWYVRYALASVEGVAEVASVGGFVKEYQIDVDPDAMRAYGVTLDEVFAAVRASNLDVGARTIEVNRAEYVVRGLGFIESVEDLQRTVVKVRDNIPVLIENVAHVGLGPALRRGLLDKGGAEAVGGVVVVRYGENPLAVIERVKDRVAEISSGLATKTLDDGTVSQVAVVPFYDRTGLIHETLDTLNHALRDEILVTVIVVLVMVAHFQSALLISGLLPLAVLMTFIAMKYGGVDANIVALSGIAIAIGTMVDMGIVMAENVLKHIAPGDTPKQRLEAVFRAASEVGSAVLTAVLTTVVGFLPVFAMEGAEGKLFKPLAFTKTFALLASIVVALTIIPPAAHLLLRTGKGQRGAGRAAIAVLLAAGAVALWVAVAWWAGAIATALLLRWLLWRRLPERAQAWGGTVATWLAVAVFLVFLAGTWEPMGPARHMPNLLFTGGVILGVLGLFWLFYRSYESILRFCLRHKLLFLSAPTLLVVLGGVIWLGFDQTVGASMRGIGTATAEAWTWLGEEIPGLSMPPWLGLSFAVLTGIGTAVLLRVKRPSRLEWLRRNRSLARSSWAAAVLLLTYLLIGTAGLEAVAADVVAFSRYAFPDKESWMRRALVVAAGVPVIVAGVFWFATLLLGERGSRAREFVGRHGAWAGAALVLLSGITWFAIVGAQRTYHRVGVEVTRAHTAVRHAFPGLGSEFMPPLDEGSYLFMPIVSYHASIGAAKEVLQTQDMAIRAIPEVEDVVGKIGRVDSPLDPAPVGMVETIVTYKSEYVLDDHGDRVTFAYDEAAGEFVRDEGGELVPDPDGRPYRQWRPEIRSPDDIWEEIAKAGAFPGVTTASKLQPIKTRQVMLQTGMRANFGVKVYGPDLRTIDEVALEVEHLLKEVPVLRPATVVADRVVGKPYLEIHIDRDAISRHGLKVVQVQNVIEVAIGGKPITTTVEGRERYPVRVRYLRELRDQIEELERILVPAPDGTQVPMGQLADVRYAPGPQVIKSEDTFLTAYVLFDKVEDISDGEAVEIAQAYLKDRLQVPPGVSYKFAGEFENQIRAEKRLSVVLPLALFVIFLILYFQFGRVSTSLLVFSGVFVAWSGGFLMIWLYNQGWFLDFSVFGRDLRDLFQVGTVNLSVAVWVGFLALFGIATDDGVILGTYLKQSFARRQPETRQEVREAVVEAGKKRIRPCLMTVATTILALLPVMTSQGRGSDVMVPMAIPSFGGMTVVLLTVFVVPTLYCWLEERKVGRAAEQEVRS